MEVKRQVVREAKMGDVIGEIGVLCYRPQLFTARTKKLCQLLRLNRTSFLSIIQSNVGDGTIILSNLLQYLKEHEQTNTAMKGVFSEVDKMLARGRLDLPLTLNAAVSRGDDLLLHQLLKRGLDPNEGDNNQRTPLHIAASLGNENCVLLLLDYGADPNSKDNDGSVPLWEAMLGKHENVIKLLIDNGADLSLGDVGQFACLAVEQNDLELLEKIIQCGGDATVPQHGQDRNTPLHVAVNEGNVEMARFLLDQGADVDKPNIHGWTPRTLADQQGHEEIVALFQEKREACTNTRTTVAAPSPGVRFAERSCSEPVMSCVTTNGERIRRGNGQGRRKGSNFPNSLFGIMSAARGDGNGLLSSEGPPNSSTRRGLGDYTPPRVTISCPESMGTSAKLVLLPGSMEELLELGAKRFGLAMPTKVLTRDGAEIDEVELIRDGDHLLLVSSDWNGELHCNNNDNNDPREEVGS
ncbi:potassium channel AKT1-like [Iris pallida]|uniref:Potassium channel AKT1-like n=1 Tax=Iris pallida TaxID=29817 RepID=A0AAX6FVU6_IRIPA|nr:potassium channel AKT1-like [Iris pallida]